MAHVARVGQFVRLEQAKRLLAADGPVTDVCMDVGFSSSGASAVSSRAGPGRRPRPTGAEYARLRAPGVAFTTEPTPAGAVAIAVFSDTVSDLIQLYQVTS